MRAAGGYTSNLKKNCDASTVSAGDSDSGYRDRCREEGAEKTQPEGGLVLRTAEGDDRALTTRFGFGERCVGPPPLKKG